MMDGIKIGCEVRYAIDFDSENMDLTKYLFLTKVLFQQLNITFTKEIVDKYNLQDVVKKM